MSTQKKIKKATIITTSELATDHRLHKLAGTLQQAGYECEFVCRIKNGHLPYHGKYPVRTLNTLWQRSPLFYLMYNLRIFLHLLFHKTDLIVSIDLDTLVGCGMAKLLKSSKLLFDSHEYFPESPEISAKPLIKNTWLLAQKIFIPLVDIGVTVCQPIAEIFQKKYGKSFLVIRNAPQKQTQTSKQVNAADNSKFTILYQGAVNEGRALRELVQAMHQIERGQLVIIGDGDIFEELRALAAPLGNKVIMRGKVPFNELNYYTSQADLGVALLNNMGLNNYYALPNRLFDALHAGLPMLGINFPEIKGFIEEHSFGITIDSVAPEEIAKAINKLIDQPEPLKQWRNNALKAKLNVNWENETAPLLKALKTMN
ncbi:MULTISPECIES: glycosyltransferase [unclassified Carboxylicivirga]|uniref:glycosyltransferase n=1 Tax=Carboxylicivirga TaxID=1628153 RepID=UPI003D33E0C1